MQIPQLPADKAAHAIAGACIFAAIGGAAALAGFGDYARYAGACAAAGAGVLKELSDYRLNQRAIARGEQPPHGVELLDLAATVAGALFVWGAAIATAA